MASDRLARARQSVWGPTASRIRQSRLRDTAIQTYRWGARRVLTGPPPRVFANSIPKSGTHLLTQVLTGTPKLWYSALHTTDNDFLAPGAEFGSPIDAEAFRARASVVRDGQYMTAHMGAGPGLTKVLHETGFRTLVMVRDPRDVAVSLAFYYAGNARLKYYETFQELGSPQAQLMAVITGLPATATLPALPPIGAVMRKYVPWTDDPDTEVIRFEELVGEAGGGTTADQRATVRRILAHCRRDTSDATVDRICATAFARHGATFRRGGIGDWVNHFTPEHTAAFEETAAEGLAAWGVS